MGKTHTVARWIAVSAAFLVVSLLAAPFQASAGQRWLVGTKITRQVSNDGYVTIVADPIRDRIYVGDRRNKKVLVIDTNTETQIEAWDFPAGFINHIAISKDGSKAAVVLEANKSITIRDLDTGTSQVLTVNTPNNFGLADAVWDHRDHLWVSTVAADSPLYRVNPSAGGAIVETISNGFKSGLGMHLRLTTDPEGVDLYVFDYSNARIVAYNIAPATAQFVAEKASASLAISDYGYFNRATGTANELDYLFTASRTGNRKFEAYHAAGADEALDLQLKQSFDMAAYIGGIAVEPDGASPLVYAYSSDVNYDRIFQYRIYPDTVTFVKHVDIARNPAAQAGRPMSGVLGCFALNRTGTKLFFANGDVTAPEGGIEQLGVIDTDRQPPAKPVVTGPATPTADQTPTITWNAVTDATIYHLWVNNVTTNTEKIIYLENLTGTSYTPGSDLPLANYRVWVRAANAYGASPWSASYSFTIAAAAGDPPGTTAFTAPTAETTDTTPTIGWTAAARATKYELWVDRVTPSQSKVIYDANVTPTSYTPATALALGTYKAWVRGINASGTGAWSPVFQFKIISASATPAVPSLTAPTGSQGDVKRPRFQWTAAARATSYELWVDDVTRRQTVISQQNIAATYFDPASDLNDGQYKAWVRAANASGNSAWSVPVTFSVGVAAPSTPALTGPVSPTTDSTPRITWSAADRAASYDLWVDNLGTGAKKVIYQTGLTDLYYEQALLVNGTYRSWVRAVNAGGNSAWSAQRDFTVAAPVLDPPTAPTLTAPIGTVTGNTGFTWTIPARAQTYNLWVENSAKVVVINKTNLVGNTFTPTIRLENGNFTAWVQAANSGGKSAWSAPRTFTVNNPDSPPDSTVLTGPPAATSQQKPQFTWSAAARATKYELWVSDAATGDTVLNQTDIAALSFTPASNLPFGDYHAWVRASNQYGNGTWSPKYSFTVVNGEVVNPPVLLAPYGYWRVGDLTMLCWVDAQWAAGTKYDVWLDDRSNGTTVINVSGISGTMSGSAGTATRLCMYPSQLIPAPTFVVNHSYRFWVRKQAASGSKSAWSLGTDIVLIGTNTALAAPALLPLATGNTLASTMLQWMHVGGDAYDLWIDNRTTGTTEYYRGTLQAVYALFGQFGDANLPIGDYRAWVRGKNNRGFSSWSNAMNFSIRTGQTPPATPSIVGPKDYASTTDRTPPLQWSAVSGAVGYKLYMLNVNTGGLVLVLNISGTSYSWPTDLQTGLYLWAVQAEDSAGRTSDWSSCGTNAFLPTCAFYIK